MNILWVFPLKNGLSKFNEKTYYSKHSDSSSQQENKVICTSFIKNLVYWNYLYIQINYTYWLIHVM